MAYSQFLDLGDKHGESPLTSFSWKPGSGPPAATDERQGVQTAQGADLYLTRDFDGYSPILLQYSGSGIHFEKASLNIYRSRNGNPGELSVSYIMSSVYVTQYHSNGKSDGFGINFDKLEIAYYVYDDQGGRHKVGDPN